MQLNGTLVLSATTAVVVTFNIGERFSRYVETYQNSFRRIVIVDNGSADSTPELLDRLAREHQNVTVIKLERNLGLATAQNIGMRKAFEDAGTSFIFLLDHDSCPGAESLNLLADFAAATIEDETIGLLGMLPVEEGSTGEDVHVTDAISEPILRCGTLITPAMTIMASGSLIRRSTLECHGLFDDDLFIDDIDHDYSLKLHCAGLKNYVVNKAVLIHNLGERIEINFLGKVRRITWHSPFRRYYITRNAIWMWRRYFWRLPGYTLADACQIFKDTFKVLVLDSKHRQANTRAVLKGLKDGLFHRVAKI
jgi:rhamnosyltransferase